MKKQTQVKWYPGGHTGNKWQLGLETRSAHSKTQGDRKQQHSGPSLEERAGATCWDASLASKDDTGQWS